MRLIDADMLIERMYHDAFETDTDMQKWDSGCWIRYKMFENAIFSATTIDAVSVVRCKDCRRNPYGCVMDIKPTETINPDGFCNYGEKEDE